ncbi:MAG TPA: ATP-dependent zinc metalloprotease FtsH, partial [Ardenticatenaceae bacterium]
PFFSISGSEFVEMFVGVGASRVRDLFEQAKRNAPCIIFIDEIDAVGRQRGAGLGGSHDEREQTLNQILVEMDGFDTETNIIIIAATNRPDILDPALLRPGRFDRRVTLDRPDLNGRRAILDVHVRGKPLSKDVDLHIVAAGTPGFSGADIENLVNEAAILTARRNKKAITMSEMQEAIERVLMGPERKSRLISKREKRVIAFHEAGHAVVKHFLPLCNPVHKITIVSRGMAGGYVLALPKEDENFMRRAKFMEEMAGMLGGRVAEEITFGDVTTGASNDLERVTQMARAMVTRYGMSPKLGPMTFGEREELIFLGREISEQRNYSEDVAELIDAEVRAIVDEAYANARRVLDANQDKLGVLAEALMEKETMGREEFVALMEGNPPPTPTRPSPPKPSGQQRTTPTEGDDLASGDISFSPAPA